MTIRRLCALVLLVAPTLSFGASREIQELQRDLGLLQEQVRTLQRSQDEKLAALTVLAQQALDASNKANTAVAVLQNNLGQNVKDQETKIVAPVVGMGARLDQMASDFRGLQQAVSDLTTMASKLQAQMTDLGNAVKVMQTPAAPPPPVAGPGGAAGAPPMPASDLYANAQRDRSGGKPDLALQEFADYLKWYGDTDLAPNAQFFIGEVHFSQGDFESALTEFDLVLEKYPDNSKTPDALYMKGLSLVRLGRRTQGAEEFKELNKRFPNNDLSKKACSQLTTMGLKCGVPGAAAPRTSSRATKAKK